MCPRPRLATGHSIQGSFKVEAGGEVGWGGAGLQHPWPREGLAWVTRGRATKLGTAAWIIKTGWVSMKDIPLVSALRS